MNSKIPVFLIICFFSLSKSRRSVSSNFRSDTRAFARQFSISSVVNPIEASTNFSSKLSSTFMVTFGFPFQEFMKPEIIVLTSSREGRGKSISVISFCISLLISNDGEMIMQLLL